MIRIVQAETEEQMAQTRELFEEYEKAIGFELDFQNFTAELDSLPGKYAPPRGMLLLAYHGEKLAGCVAVREFDSLDCEMKRLYVRPDFRQYGLGRQLSEQIIGHARQMGYKRMFLDTIDWMKEAIGLYQSLGFEETKPYRHNPMKGAKFFVLGL